MTDTGIPVSPARHIQTRPCRVLPQIRSSLLLLLAIAMLACLGSCPRPADQGKESDTASQAEPDNGQPQAKTPAAEDNEPQDPLSPRRYSESELELFRGFLAEDPGSARRKLLDEGAVLSSDYLIDYMQRGKTVMVVRMIAAGIDLNAPASDGRRPITEAVLVHDRYLLDLMLEYGANPLLRDDETVGFGRSLLHYAAKANNTGLINELLDMGLSVDQTDIQDQTALDVAAVFGQTDALQLLIERGADPLRVEKGGSMPILHAAGTGQTESVRLLMEHGADINTRHERGWTPLILAVYYNNDDTANFLLDNGAAIDARIEEGFGLAGIAATLGNAAMLRRMIDAGAPLDYQLEGVGRTIFHACVEGNLHDFIDELALLGLDPMQADSEGRTPLDFALELENEEAIAILNKYQSAGEAAAEDSVDVETVD